MKCAGFGFLPNLQASRSALHLHSQRRNTRRQLASYPAALTEAALWLMSE